MWLHACPLLARLAVIYGVNICHAGPVVLESAFVLMQAAVHAGTQHPACMHAYDRPLPKALGHGTMVISLPCMHACKPYLRTLPLAPKASSAAGTAKTLTQATLPTLAAINFQDERCGSTQSCSYQRGGKAARHWQTSERTAQNIRTGYFHCTCARGCMLASTLWQLASVVL